MSASSFTSAKVDLSTLQIELTIGEQSFRMPQWAALDIAGELTQAAAEVKRLEDRVKEPA